MRYYLVTAQEAVILLDPSRPVPMRSVVEGVNRSLPFKSRKEADAWLEAEHANLVATVTHAVTQTDSVARYAVWLTQPLQWFLYPRARTQDLQTINELALGAARRLGDPESEALALNNLSAAHWLHRRYDEMRACLESALAVWRGLGDHRGEQRSLCNLADALTELELYEEAISVQERQLSAARELGDRVAELTGLANLGRAYQGLGRTSEALACFEQSLEHARRIGDANHEGYALYEIGVLKSEIGAATMDQEMIEEGWAEIERALPVCMQRETYTSWRGHAWSAFFPVCMSMGATWDSGNPVRF